LGLIKFISDYLPYFEKINIFFNIIKPYDDKKKTWTLANLLEIGLLYKVVDMQLNKKKCSPSNCKNYEVILVCCHGNEKNRMFLQRISEPSLT
jgi:hypothetical protein